MSSPTKPVKKSKKRRSKTRDRILEVALHRFSYSGYDAVSTVDIAEEVGCSQPTVMYHFNTKKILWQAAMESLFEKIDAREYFNRDAFQKLDPVKKLEVVLRRFVLLCAKYPELGRVIFREGSEGGERLEWLLDELAKKNYTVTMEIFEAGVASGDMKQFHSLMLTLMMHGAGATLFNLSPLSSSLIGTSPFDEAIVEQQADMLVDVFMYGLVNRS